MIVSSDAPQLSKYVVTNDIMAVASLSNMLAVWTIILRTGTMAGLSAYHLDGDGGLDHLRSPSLGLRVAMDVVQALSLVQWNGSIDYNG